jgi:hypothetical protein
MKNPSRLLLTISFIIGITAERNILFNINPFHAFYPCQKALYLKIFIQKMENYVYEFFRI